MDASTLKLSLINWLINLKDEKIINEVQAIRKKDFVKNYEANLKPLTEAEFLKRIEQSENNFQNGRVTSLEDIIKESDSW